MSAKFPKALKLYIDYLFKMHTCLSYPLNLITFSAIIQTVTKWFLFNQLKEKDDIIFWYSRHLNLHPHKERKCWLCRFTTNSEATLTTIKVYCAIIKSCKAD